MAIEKTSLGFSKFPYKYPFYDKEMNANFDLLNTYLANLIASGLTAGQKTLLTGGGYTTLHQHAGILAARAQWTLANGGVHYECFWGSTTTVIFKPKASPFGKFLGVILNDGEYIESSTDLTMTLNTSSLDGIGAKQNNAWYIPWFYKDSGGLVKVAPWFMPNVAINADDPTTTVTLVQLNSKDVKSLFPIGAELAMWESATKFDTPVFYYGGAYNAVRNAPIVASYPGANQITINSALGITNYKKATPAYLYAVSGYTPIDCTTEAIAAVIGSRGYADSGIRIKTDGSGNIINFAIINDRFYFVNGTGSAELSPATGYGTFGLTTSYVVYKNTFSPVDKQPIIGYSGGSQGFNSSIYYTTYGEVLGGSGGTVSFQGAITEHIKTLHGLMKLKTDAGIGAFSIYGYII